MQRRSLILLQPLHQPRIHLLHQDRSASGSDPSIARFTRAISASGTPRHSRLVLFVPEFEVGPVLCHRQRHQAVRARLDLKLTLGRRAGPPSSHPASAIKSASSIVGHRHLQQPILRCPPPACSEHSKPSRLKSDHGKRDETGPDLPAGQPRRYAHRTSGLPPRRPRVSSRRAPSPDQLPRQRQSPARRRHSRKHRPHPRLHPLRRRHPQPPRDSSPMVATLPLASASARLHGVARGVKSAHPRRKVLSSLRNLSPHRRPPHRRHAAKPLARLRTRSSNPKPPASPATSPSSARRHLDAPANWDLHLTDAEHARAREALAPAASHPIIAVSVGTKVQSKDWGRDNWRALLNRLATLYSRPRHCPRRSCRRNRSQRVRR